MPFNLPLVLRTVGSNVLPAADFHVALIQSLVTLHFTVRYCLAFSTPVAISYTLLAVISSIFGQTTDKHPHGQCSIRPAQIGVRHISHLHCAFSQTRRPTWLGMRLIQTHAAILALFYQRLTPATVQSQLWLVPHIHLSFCNLIGDSSVRSFSQHYQYISYAPSAFQARAAPKQIHKNNKVKTLSHRSPREVLHTLAHQKVQCLTLNCQCSSKLTDCNCSCWQRPIRASVK